MFGTESSQMSFLYYLTYLASAGASVKNLIEGSEYCAQERTIKVGIDITAYQVFRNGNKILRQEVV